MMNTLKVKRIYINILKYNEKIFLQKDYNLFLYISLQYKDPRHYYHNKTDYYLYKN